MNPFFAQHTRPTYFSLVEMALDSFSIVDQEVGESIAPENSNLDDHPAVFLDLHCFWNDRGFSVRERDFSPTT
jgi:hypothetical protein